jgi:CspA family cold shock protein
MTRAASGSNLPCGPARAQEHHLCMREVHAAVVGTVEVWHAEDGWGVLRTPGGLSVWCHFSHVIAEGYRELSAGDRVSFDYETPGQDGCEGRVLTAAAPVADDGSVAAAAGTSQDMSGAHTNVLG